MGLETSARRYVTKSFASESSVVQKQTDRAVYSHDAMTTLYRFGGSTGNELHAYFYSLVKLAFSQSPDRECVYVLIFDGDNVDPHKDETRKKRRLNTPVCADTACSDEKVPTPFIAACQSREARRAILSYLFGAFRNRTSLRDRQTLILQGPEGVWTGNASGWTHDPSRIPVKFQEGDCAAFYWLNRLRKGENDTLVARSLDSDLFVIGLLQESVARFGITLLLEETQGRPSRTFHLAECVKVLGRRGVSVDNFCFLLILQGTDHCKRSLFYRIGVETVLEHALASLEGVKSFWDDNRAFQFKDFRSYYTGFVNTLASIKKRKLPDRTFALTPESLETALWNMRYWGSEQDS